MAEGFWWDTTTTTTEAQRLNVSERGGNRGRVYEGRLIDVLTAMARRHASAWRPRFT